MQQVNEIIDWAHLRGWTHSRTRGGHIKFEHPEVPKAVFASSTPSDMNENKILRGTIMRHEREAGITPHIDLRGGSVEPFKRGRNGPAAVYTATCTGCGHAEQIETKDKNTTEARIGKKFRSLGWFIMRERSRDLCPKCYARKQAAETKAKAEKLEAMKAAAKAAAGDSTMQKPAVSNGAGNGVASSAVNGAAGSNTLTLPDKPKPLGLAINPAIPKLPTEAPPARTECVVSIPTVLLSTIDGLALGGLFGASRDEVIVELMRQQLRHMVETGRMATFAGLQIQKG